jgi:hypothetical protein
MGKNGTFKNGRITKTCHAASRPVLRSKKKIPFSTVVGVYETYVRLARRELHPAAPWAIEHKEGGEATKAPSEHASRLHDLDDDGMTAF